MNILAMNVQGSPMSSATEAGLTDIVGGGFTTITTVLDIADMPKVSVALRYRSYVPASRGLNVCTEELAPVTAVPFRYH